VTPPKVNLDEGRALLDARNAEEAATDPHDPRPANVDWLVWARTYAEQLLDMVDDLRLDLDGLYDGLQTTGGILTNLRTSVHRLIAGVDMAAARAVNDEIRDGYAELSRWLRLSLGENRDSYVASPASGPAPLCLGWDYGRLGYKVALVRHRGAEATYTELVADLDTIVEERFDGQVKQWTITLTPPKQ